MHKTVDKKYPIIRKGEGGYWHAYGNGWAVCAPTKESAKKKYQEMLDFINELLSRPVVKTIDIH
jgi:hypothetical protein